MSFLSKLNQNLNIAGHKQTHVIFLTEGKRKKILIFTVCTFLKFARIYFVLVLRSNKRPNVEAVRAARPQSLLCRAVTPHHPTYV